MDYVSKTPHNSLMNSQVKICGLTRAKDVEAAIRHGADYLGFIVEAKSKRQLSVSDAAKIARPAMGIVPRVAVTVNPDDDLLDRIMAHMQPDVIQCHGDETPERVADIAKRCHVSVIKAVAVRTDEDMHNSERYAGFADFILYDAKAPDGAARGGHGEAFDWQILMRNPRPRTFALAGGLTPENIDAAMSLTKAPIFDVSSGVEYEPGKKDPAKIRRLIARVKKSV